MKSPLFSKVRTTNRKTLLRGERGVTMALVAISMVAILAMAALSIDTITLYLAREEAQRSADAAALAGARILSLSGMTGDPGNIGSGSWTPACNAAISVATTVAQQNQIAGQSLPAAQITVTFPNNSACGTAPIFGINPEIAVKVSRQNLPTFFARIWGLTSNTVVANATAEAFNPSNSGSVAAGGTLIPVQPRCVKPLIVANKDPGNLPNALVNVSTGSINNPGVSQLNGGVGVIGEQFYLTSPCASNCDITPGPSNLNHPPSATATGLDYIPAQTTGPYTAVSSANGSCSNSDGYEEAIDGCDQGTQYNCGASLGANIDLDVPVVSPTIFGGETSTAIQCLSGVNGTQDTIHPGNITTPIYPYQIWAGLANPLAKAGIVNNDDLVTTSNSIITLPIYDSTVSLGNNHQAVTIVGFLQVFVSGFDLPGDPQVTVLNVSGCGNSATGGVTGTSPVPIRLITPP